LRVQNVRKAALISAQPIYLLSISLVLYLLIYTYHGFEAFVGDTIQTVPYSLWLSDPSLFVKDFYIGNLVKIFPNEQWVVSFLLHFFPDNLYLASRGFHLFFSLLLISGMIRLGDLMLRNMEWSVVAVFVTVICLQDVSLGLNELYYNKFIPSLAANGIAIWGFVFFWQKKLINSSLFLAMSCFLHPFIGLPLFVVFSIRDLSATCIRLSVYGYFSSFFLLQLVFGYFLFCGLRAQKLVSTVI